MKKNLILLVSLIVISAYQFINAQEPDWNRVLQLSTFGNQIGNVVTGDSNFGYLAGSITGPVTFEGTNFTSVGLRDMILAKINTSGVTSWKKQVDAQAGGTVSANAIKTDPDGNVYVSGLFYGTITVGTTSVSSVTLAKGFMAKFDPSGNGIWVTSFDPIGSGGTSKITIDSHSNVYLISLTRKLLKFKNDGTLQWEQLYPQSTLQAVAVHDSDLFLGGALQQGITTFGTMNLTSWYTINSAFLVKGDLKGSFSSAVVNLTFPMSTKEGTYMASGTFIHPTAGTRIINQTKTLTGTSENVLSTTVGDLQSNQGTLILTINADSSVTIGGTVIGETNPPVIATPGMENRYSPYERKFYLNYQYTMSTGVRKITEALTRAYSYSGFGSAITDMALASNGDLIITGDYSTKLNLPPISLSQTTSSPYTYTFIARCNDYFYFQWVKSSNSLVPMTDSEKMEYRVFVDGSGYVYEYGTTGNLFTFGTVSVNPAGGQYMIRFDPLGNAMQSFPLQNTLPDKVFTSVSVRTYCTGSYDFTGATTFGNLFLTQYNSSLTQDWKKVSSNSQSGTARIAYVKHDTTGNTFVKARIRGYCNFFGTIIKKDNEVTVNAKLDLNGNAEWISIIPDTLSYASEGSFFGPKFSLDNEQKLLTAGTFGSSLVIGTVTLSNQNSYEDGYIVKYTSNGQIDWVTQLKTDGALNISGVVADKANNVVVSGEFNTQLTVSGTTVTSNSIDGAFVFKLDKNGNLLWIKGYPIGGVVYHMLPSIDGNNNIYLSSDIVDPANKVLTFGSVSTPQPESEATVLAKLDPDGSTKWVKTYGAETGDPTSISWPVDIRTDNAGNSYMWGWCETNASFGSTILVNPLGSSMSYYLAKINTSGDVVWAKAIYEKNYGFNYGDLLDLDNSGNIYVGGHFKAEIKIGNNSYFPAGANDFFVVKYTNDGNYLWMKSIPNDMTQIINGMSVFKDNVLSIGGYAGKNSSLGSFEIFKKGGSSCIVATLGNLKYLDVSPSTLSVEAAASNTGTLRISSNIAWTASSNQSWATLSTYSGTGFATVVLIAAENTADADRLATITINGTGVETKTVSVTQAGLKIGIGNVVESSRINIYPNPNNGKFSYILNIDNPFVEKVTISNSLGIVVKEVDRNGQSGSGNNEIDLGNVPAGLYFIFLESGKTTIRKTFIVK
jgi:hypothetical protein